jgi:hypothetical protein
LLTFFFSISIKEKKKVRRQWLAANCADSPTPRAWEVTKNVQILYHWIETLGSGKYIVDVPGTHSQRIFLR